MKHLIKWIYFYTEDYEFWHQHLTESLNGVFDLQSILLSPMKTEGRAGVHHFTGVSIKIELLIKSIEENIGNSIIFSDCTLWVNSKNKNTLQDYIDGMKNKYDIVFADNAIDRSANIGFILIKCNKRSLRFFRKILMQFKKSSWDQQLINDALPGIFLFRVTRFEAIHELRRAFQWIGKHLNSSAITWSLFDSRVIVCGSKFDERYRASFCLYKQFISPSSPSDNWNQRLQKLHEYGMLELSDLEKNIRR